MMTNKCYFILELLRVNVKTKITTIICMYVYIDKDNLTDYYWNSMMNNFEGKGEGDQKGFMRQRAKGTYKKTVF